MSTLQQAVGPNIDSILTEKRSFPPPPEFSKNAHIRSKEDYDKLCARAAADPEGLLGRHRAPAALVRALEQGAGMGFAVGEVVPGRQDQSLLQLPRSPRPDLAQEQGCHHLGERARRSPHPHLSAAAERGLQVRQRAEVAGHQVRRSRRHLHGHVSGAADRHAGLRAHRRGALRHLRWILRQRAGRSHHRSGSRRRDHAGRLVSPRRRSQAESPRWTRRWIAVRP